MSRENKSGRQGPKKIYRLSSREREFLKTDEARGGYSRPKYEKLIQKKVDTLPARIQALSEDVALLQESGRLDQESWLSGWLALLGFPTEPTRTELDAGFTYHAPESGATPTSKPTELGHRLGEVVDQLLLAPGPIDSDQVRQDVLWGFFSQLFIDNRPSREFVDEELPRYVSETTELLTRRSQVRKESQEEFWAGSDESDRWKDHKRAMEFHVVALLRDGAITTDSTDIEDCQLAINIVDCFIDAMMDEGAPGTAAQWAAFRDAYDPIEFDVESELTAQRVQLLLDDYRIVERTALDEQVREDVDDLRDQTWRGVSAEDVLLSIADHGSASSADVSRDLDVHKNQSAVTRLTRDLAGDKRDGGRVWEERPLLTGDRDQWKATAYGNVVATRLVEHSVFITGDLISEEELTAALAEFHQ